MYNHIYVVLNPVDDIGSPKLENKVFSTVHAIKIHKEPYNNMNLTDEV